MIPISKPYKMTSREFKKENTVVEIPDGRGKIIRAGGQRVVVIADLGVFENPSHFMENAGSVASSGASLFYADVYENRISIDDEKIEENLLLLKKAGEKFGIPVISRIRSESHIALVKKYADVISVDPDKMRDYDFLKKIGSCAKPVILKRNPVSSLEDFLMSAEQLLLSGCEN
ncbi:MAG: phospho-2-dehydro-3-deoxyheptonate aldolase, partial [Treponema sp.]|nr:phospho-2-dehydro-3-deoxyheptonate aldolase [Treponema sp.]